MMDYSHLKVGQVITTARYSGYHVITKIEPSVIYSLTPRVYFKKIYSESFKPVKDYSRNNRSCLGYSVRVLTELDFLDLMDRSVEALNHMINILHGEEDV